jgi:DNA repair exonuclease SbcCD nuclease subunit
VLGRVAAGRYGRVPNTCAEAPLVRFVHTADLQLGMRRHVLDGDGQARFAAARVDAIRTIGALAADRDAAFVVVAGDVFEHNQVDRRTVLRALDAFGDVSVPVLLLPGNHDPLDAASVYRSRAFIDHAPDHLTVLDGAPLEVVPGVEVVSAPWRTKRPLTDLAAEAVADLPADGTLRVLVAHGGVDTFHPQRIADPAAIRLAPLEAALADRRIHAVCLGDRHSTTTIGTTGRIHYAGAPEPTAVRETDPGNVLVWDVDHDRCEVAPHRVGTWRFAEVTADLAGDDDVRAPADRLTAIDERERTIVVLRWSGTVTLAGRAALDDLVSDARDVFAGVDVRGGELAVTVDGASLDHLQGFARWTVDALAADADGGDAEALDALGLLHRLASA